jgi:hypothetical protein
MRVIVDGFDLCNCRDELSVGRGSDRAPGRYGSRF